MSKRDRNTDGISSSSNQGTAPTLSEVFEIMNSVHEIYAETQKIAPTDSVLHCAFTSNIVLFEYSRMIIENGPQNLVNHFLAMVLNALDGLFDWNVLLPILSTSNNEAHSKLRAVSKLVQANKGTFALTPELLTSAFLINDERIKIVLCEKMNEWRDALDDIQQKTPDYHAYDTNLSRKRVKTTLFNAGIKCEDHEHHLLIMLGTYLNSNHSIDPPCLDLLISSNHSEDQYEEVRIHIAETKSDTSRVDDDRNLIRRFCEQLGESASDFRHEWNQNKALEFYSQNSSDFKLPWKTDRDLVSFYDVLNSYKTSPSFRGSSTWSGLPKLSLVVILSHALIHICTPSKLNKRWPRQDIYFLQHAKSTLLRPFLKVSVDHDLQCVDSLPSTLPTYPALVDFGIILLEIYFCKTVQSTVHEQTSPVQLTDDLKRLRNMYSGRKYSISSRAFRTAIEFCINPATRLDANASTKDYEDYIHRNIVGHFQWELENGQGMAGPLEEIDDRACCMDIEDGNPVPVDIAINEWQRAGPRTDYYQRTLSSATATQKSISLKEGMSSSRMISTDDSTFEEPASYLPNAGTFIQMGEERPRKSVPNNATKSQKRSDKWLSEFDRVIETLSGNHSTHASANKVRIAILDTGINTDVPVIRGCLGTGQIKRVCNFVGADGSDDKDRSGDDDGHGTHIASIILKWAPNAEVSIARISSKVSLDDDSELSISKAIECARKVWEVDIITMSFGLVEFSQPIDEELREAIHAGILLFAAASNDGSRESRAYPASRDQVFCIHSTNGSNEWLSDSNPAPKKDELNFAILGQNIRPLWRESGTSASGERLNGASYATALAVALSGSVLAWINQDEKLQHMFGKRKGYNAFRKVLRLMVDRDAVGKHPIDPAKYLFNLDLPTVRGLVRNALDPG